MWSNFKAWLSEPFKAPVSGFDLFMIVGLVLVSAVLWNILLRHIFEGLEG